VDAALPADGPALAPVRVDFLDPDHGPFLGGTEVTVKGKGFAAGMTVTIGGRNVDPADVDVLDGARAIVTTPPGNPGEAEVSVTVGDIVAGRPAGFHYEPIAIDPAVGAAAGGTYVTIQGFGTKFQTGDEVLVDGMPLLTPTIVNATEIVGYTPPGDPGMATVTVRSGGATFVAEDAFRYESTVDPFRGGFGGGPIDGSIDVTVLDGFTLDGIPHAFVSLGDPMTTPFKGRTDSLGQITLSGPGLRGPVTLIAAQDKYEWAAFVDFDARNVTLYLTPHPEAIDPPTGPFPPGRSGATIAGDIVFGGETGIGTTQWDLVPDPRTPSEIKRAYVFTTAPTIFTSSPDPGPGGTVDYVDGQIAWHFEIPARPAALAVVAVAGLYDPAADPDGPGPLPPGTFTPFALGVARNLLLGPGEDLAHLSISIDIPLDSAVDVDLGHAPAIAPKVAPWRGPTEYRVNAVLDLGGEGVFRLPGGRSVTQQTNVLMTGMAPLVRGLADASYTIAAGAYTVDTTLPYSIRVVRGVTDLGRPVRVDDFLGIPRAVDPPPNGTATLPRILIAPDDGPTGAPTWFYHTITTTDGIPVWRVLASPRAREFDFPDLAAAGLSPMPAVPMLWNVLSITVPGVTFDQFSYGYLNANAFSAYAGDTYAVSFP
jgi:hypothetical protein